MPRWCSMSRCHGPFFLPTVVIAVLNLLLLPYTVMGGKIIGYEEQSEILNPGEAPLVDPLDFQDDIRVMESIDREKRNALRDGRALWKGKIIPYVMNAQLSSRARQAILDAITDYDAYTCVRFVPREPKKHPDFVEFIRDKGCYSYVGRNGGRQTLSLGEGCEVKGIAIHEMMHVVGFMHEQSRSDRDTFVTVLYQNIPRKLWDQFDKMKTRQENNLGSKYDYNSVMHYSRKAFTANGRDTILPKVDGAAIGQRRGFSTVDVHKINHLYGCPELSHHVTGGPGSSVIEHVVSSTVDPSSGLTGGGSAIPPIEQENTLSPRSPTTVDPNLAASTTDQSSSGPAVPPPPSCVNRRNRLYCDLKKSTGWCRKSTTVAFEHCPETCGACDSKAPPPAPTDGGLAPSGELGSSSELSVNGTEEASENEDCRPGMCCDKWKQCFEFHCVLYSHFCSKTCALCKDEDE